MTREEFDLAVIGAGTGGYAAAIRASELGMKVALIEKDKVGGTCLHRGCVPTKALLGTAELMEVIRRADKFGINCPEPELDWRKTMEAKQATVDRLYKGLQQLLSGRNIKIVKGLGRLARPGHIAVSDSKEQIDISAPAQIIAAGSSPNTIGLPVDGNRVITSDNALDLKTLPSSVIIIGGGYVGVEFASMWRSFGAEVTIIELLPHILPTEDEDIARQLTNAFQDRGINIKSGVKFEDANVQDGRVIVTISVNGKSETISAEKLMVAAGRSAVSNGIGLSNWGIKSDRGFLNVDARLETTHPNTYAVGDIIKTPQLAHVAFAEGIFVAEELSGLKVIPPNYEQMPRCVYSYPEVAAVGLTEKQAEDKGIPIRVAIYPFLFNSKATIIGDTVGICKMVAAEDGPILGIHLIGPRVTELIAEATIATNWEAMPEELAGIIHPHPTLSESIGETAMKMAGKPLHIGGSKS